MKKPVICTVCIAEQETGVLVDTSRPKTAWAEAIGVTEASIRRHLKHPPRTSAISDAGDTSEKPEVAPERIVSTSEDSSGGFGADWIRNRALTIKDAEDWVRSAGKDPADYEIGVTTNAYGLDQWSNKLSARPKRFTADSAPSWPVVHPADPVSVVVPDSDFNGAGKSRPGYQLSLKCADTQIGFRKFEDTLEPFHDQQAMDLFTKVALHYQPDSIVILGDFLDLPSQGRFAQEAAFANTTQLALNAAHSWLATLRAACPDTIIIIIEGNHDARMQRFIETNALAAFGLKQANLPESWPVMSLPSLLRLDDLNIQYVDAYPAATYWDNALTRNIHGTKANSKGSTTSQYVHELPHVNTWAGHTHRVEVTYRTVLGAYGEAVESYSANPGALCRTDGAVPSVNGSQHSNGTSAKIVEPWQQGLGFLWHNETESHPEVYRIQNGSVVINGTRF